MNTTLQVGAAVAFWAAAFAGGCGGDDDPDKPRDAGAGTSGQGGSGGTTVDSGGSGGTTVDSGGSGGSTVDSSTSDGSAAASGAGAMDAGVDADTGLGDAASDGSSACTPGCGAVELCDPAHAGSDDNCNGQVDEGCPCVPGLITGCFKGDPSYRNAAGCYDGIATCSEQGSWGACMGGLHATDSCFASVGGGCHALEGLPFVSSALKDGIGNFGANAVSATYAVKCPSGVSKCPAVQTGDTFVAFQSGQYSVTYTKTVAGPAQDSCEFPLFVRAPGLRVELTWERSTADSGVDLDLHLHEPGTSTPWGFSAGDTQDCNWSNCSADAFSFGSGIKWFADAPAVPPAAVNWWLDPTSKNNTCYSAPSGKGAVWQSIGKGCHNPRVDMDSDTCDFSVTDPNAANFCRPENINIDYPPLGKWTRIGVHYFSSAAQTYAVHPEVKIFCDGGLAAHLGPQGYYSPQAPVTFAASDGVGPSGTRFWTVADVAFAKDACGKTYCSVKPIYASAATRTPFFGTDTTAALNFGPAYPPPP